MKDKLIKEEVDKVNRIEVINHSKDGKGREYVKWSDDIKVELSFQDDDRTLKIFITDKVNNLSNS